MMAWDHLRSERLAILEWLGRIVRERFSEAVRLTQDQPRWARLSVAGSPVAILIQSDFDSFNQAQSDLPCSRWDATGEGWHAALAASLPAPGTSALPTPLIQPVPEGYAIRYDILGLAYWMLSRKEEVGRADLDEHDRFPATASHAFQHGYLERPIVDEWFDVLAQVMSLAWPQLSLRNHAFHMRVSHDVDGPSRYAFSTLPQLTRSMAGDVLKRRSIGRAIRAPWIWCQSRTALHPDDPANTFDWIMDQSDRHGLVSAFYFICGRTDPRRDARYEPEHPAIRSLMRRIHARGHEIGLHPSYNTFQRPEAIADEARRLARVCEQERIERKVSGGRMHFLRWETPTTLYGWELAEMDYDSSLGYADRPGFRCGTCHEYSAFDPARYRSLNLRIRPLIAMDVTVLGANRLGLEASNAAREKFLQLKRGCQAVKGNFTLLWHNSELETAERKALYASLMG